MGIVGLRSVMMMRSVGLVVDAVHVDVDVQTVVSASVGVVAGRPCEEEHGARVMGVDDEHPCVALPQQRFVEILQLHKLLILPFAQHQLHVGVASVPPGAEEVCRNVDAHVVVEVDFEDGLILVVGEVEFVRHLVAEEEGFALCVRKDECVGSYGHHCRQGQD